MDWRRRGSGHGYRLDLIPRPQALDPLGQLDELALLRLRDALPRRDIASQPPLEGPEDRPGALQQIDDGGVGHQPLALTVVWTLSAAAS
jgi:hypothetical protein